MISISLNMAAKTFGLHQNNSDSLPSCQPKQASAVIIVKFTQAAECEYLSNSPHQSSQCNCSPTAVLHTEDVVRLPKTYFSLAKTGNFPVISKPLIFYQYLIQWVRSVFLFVFWVRFREIRFEIEIELLRICKQVQSLNILPLFSFLFFFCMNTCVRWCDHEVALMQQFLRREDQHHYQMHVSSMDLTYFIWANPFEKARCAIIANKNKTWTWFMVDLERNLPWICLGAQLQPMLIPTVIHKGIQQEHSPTEYM